LIIIVAINGGAPLAYPVLARVFLRANIAVITRGVDVFIHTIPCFERTIFIGARVSVITEFLVSTHTKRPLAVIIESTEISVLARNIHKFMHTPCLRVTPIIGALVSIIALQHLSLALPLQALIVGGAQGFIVAKLQVGEKATAPFGIAAVIGTGIVVEAFRGSPRHTLSCRAEIIIRTVVSVFTKGAIGHV
jgi:hypothetical protein